MCGYISKSDRSSALSVVKERECLFMKRKNLRIFCDLGLVLLFLTFATVVGAIFNQLGLHKTNVVVVYIFSVLLIARFTKGYLWGITASVISLLLFN